MSSAIGPFAVDEGLVAKPRSGEAVVRIHNTNTRKIIVSRFAMDGNEAAVAGDMALDGVAGTGAPIRLEFMEPGGAKTGRLLPTGNATDTLQVEGLGRVPASLVDAANPCVFVPAEAIGATATELPTQIEQNPGLLAKLEAIRRAASVAMGIASDLEKAGTISVPIVSFVAPPAEMTVLSGRRLAPADMPAPLIPADTPVSRLISLQGRAAVVTGAARGFGYHIARRLAEAGARVLLGDRNVNGVREAAAAVARDHGVDAQASELEVSD